VPRKLIGEFLVELSEDPDLLRQYQADQRRFLRERSDLSEEQQEILCSNDLKRIRDAIRDEYKKAEVFLLPLPGQHVAAKGPD
jgi:hypothetical protein